jgi:hypothetical protein
MAPRLGYLLFWIASWIAAIVIAAGIISWLNSGQPNKDPLGLLIVGVGIIIWGAGRAIRYWFGGR